MTPLFSLVKVGMRYSGVDVLRSVDLSLSTGEFVAIVGPNGAGKSTLLSIMAGLAAPSSGTCRFLGCEAHRWKRRDFARRVAVVLQTERPSFPLTAADVVYMGRMPHRSGPNESAADHAAVEQAFEGTGIGRFRNRDFRTLSGGEQQRVLLACALAQSSEVLLLDEPATHLDLHHEVDLYEFLRNLSRQGRLVVAVTHDLNLAAAFADRLVIMDDGRIRANGPPAEVIFPELIGEVFKVRIELYHSASGRPWLVYGVPHGE
jgi:ABC-type cobalamin/Fe3+-siderophores transport system ATPase subunit